MIIWYHFLHRQGVSSICAAPWILSNSWRKVEKTDFLDKNNKVIWTVEQCSLISRCLSWIRLGAFTWAVTTLILPRHTFMVMLLCKMHIMLQRVRCLPRDTPRWWLCFVVSALGAAGLQEGNSLGRSPSSHGGSAKQPPRAVPSSIFPGWASNPIWFGSPGWTAPLGLTCKKKCNLVLNPVSLRALIFLRLWRLFTPQDSLVLLSTLLQTFIIALCFSPHPNTHTPLRHLWVQITILI